MPGDQPHGPGDRNRQLPPGERKGCPMVAAPAVGVITAIILIAKLARKK